MPSQHSQIALHMVHAMSMTSGRNQALESSTTIIMFIILRAQGLGCIPWRTASLCGDRGSGSLSPASPDSFGVVIVGIDDILPIGFKLRINPGLADAFVRPVATACGPGMADDAGIAGNDGSADESLGTGRMEDCGCVHRVAEAGALQDEAGGLAHRFFSAGAERMLGCAVEAADGATNTPDDNLGVDALGSMSGGIFATAKRFWSHVAPSSSSLPVGSGSSGIMSDQSYFDAASGGLASTGAPCAHAGADGCSPAWGAFQAKG